MSENLFLLNTTNRQQVVIFGGSLGVKTFSPYEVIPISQAQYDAKVGRAIENTVKAIMLVPTVPKKYLELRKLYLEATSTPIKSVPKEVKDATSTESTSTTSTESASTTSTESTSTTSTESTSTTSTESTSTTSTESTSTTSTESASN